MKLTLLGFFVVAVLLSAPQSALRADEAASSVSVMESNQGNNATMQQEMMAKWQEYATPNENHRVLDQLAGNWSYTMKSWMDPAAEPEVTTGSSANQWILDGHFIEQKVSGTSMGQPFEGRSIIGYDNSKKEYVFNWFDSMGTGIIAATGQYDPQTRTLTQEGDFTCPIKGPMSLKWVTKFIDENSYMFEAYANEGGKEYKTMEILYKKQS